jgi:hypothetical protein
MSLDSFESLYLIATAHKSYYRTLGRAAKGAALLPINDTGVAGECAPGPRIGHDEEGSTTMRATRHRGVTDVRAQRLNVRLSTEAHRRLGVHCVMTGLTPGRLLERLICDHLRDWRVQANRSCPVATEDRLEADGGVREVDVAAA